MGHTNSGYVLGLVALGVLCAATTAPALAASHHRSGQHAKPATEKPAAAATTGASKPQLVGTFGDWGAYETDGKSKICYALAKPRERSPSSLKKDAAYVFISNRPSEGVRNEISVIMGVPLKEAAAAKAEIGSSSFDLVAKGQNAWVKNAADESRFIDTLKKGGKLIVKGTLSKGGMATDSYSLAGLGPALDRVGKDCR